MTEKQDETGFVFGRNLANRIAGKLKRRRGGTTVSPETSEADAVKDPTLKESTPTQSGLAQAMIAAIQKVSSTEDREEIVRWFVASRAILDSDQNSTQKTKALYATISSKRLAQLIASSASASLRSYKDANLPLALKVALPVTAVGALTVGTQGAGIVALGGGIGLPVILLLFLGTAGVTSIIEAFMKSDDIKDPLTRFLVTLVTMEAGRRIDKEIASIMREAAHVPKRTFVPDSDQALHEMLQTMDPFDFERHVMSFFEGENIHVAVTPKSNDFGIDGCVLLPGSRTVVVQCKRHALTNTVGRPVVQQFKGVLEERKAIKGYIVTTSRFTQEAIASAQLSAKIVLVDIDELTLWHRRGSAWENP